MEYPEKINTIDNFFESTFKEKGSVFVSQVHHVEKKDEAEKILSRTRKKYYDATHHCFAYKLLGDTIKYSDDGEPNGTAGIRILNA
ncbi:MAG TPA: YigZ family protein, partial [Ignavibacteriales bacterium]|nr:YigZ family protein [Ignavibacteriales bacterium]